MKRPVSFMKEAIFDVLFCQNLTAKDTEQPRKILS